MQQRATDPGAGHGADAFGRPDGLLGRAAGRVMAWTNAPMNRVAVERLAPAPDACSLEVGFGPGEALALLLARSPRGTVAGVDPSRAMHAQAAARNREAVARSRLVLREGVVEALPFPDRAFTHALSVNNAQIWPDPERGLAELHRVLEPGGVLLVAVRKRSPSGRRLFDGIALAPAELEALHARIAAAGFRDVAATVDAAGLATAACFRGLA